MRKTLILLLAILLCWLPSVHAQHEPISRFAAIEIRSDEDRLKHRLLLNDKEVFQYEGESIDVVHVLKGQGVDYLVVGAYSGGIACPMQVVIVEVYKSGEHKVSEEFGSCLEPTKTRLLNGRVIMEMPAHIPNPDLLSKRELRSRQRTTELYTWFKGKVTKKVLTR